MPYATFVAGDMVLSYEQEGDAMGLRLLPRGQAAAHKADCAVEPLIQLRLSGDAADSGFAQGRTMRGSASTKALAFCRQSVETDGDLTTVRTFFRGPVGISAEHWARFGAAATMLTVGARLTNLGEAAMEVEMLSSFTLGGLSPLAAGEGSLTLYRVRSTWSCEGQLVCEPVARLQLEPSWSFHSVNSLRYGQLGSMPVREWAPLIGLTDEAAGVTWAARLSHAYSWQLEAARRDNGLSLSGGMADREFGHFTKRLAPGETLDAPEAYLTVTPDGWDEACFRMLPATASAHPVPDSERTLPPVFNEFCTTWGRPRADLLARLAETIAGRGLAYLVIDAGWYADDSQDWGSALGDWQVSRDLFPDGLDSALDAIRARGLVPGIWFEFEVCAEGARVFRQTELLLRRDGAPVQSGGRRFLDFTQPRVLERLRERVLRFLQTHGFGYVKVDYNESIGMGADGRESQGEMLRQQVLSVLAFFDELRRAMPQLVIEVCSSGGHRQVPDFLQRCDMASFSDAHECVEIPAVARNTLRLVEMRKSQVWAVLRPDQTPQRIHYLLCGAMLGRMCLSGDVQALSPDQWRIVQAGLDFYVQARPAIACAQTRFFGGEQPSLRHPEGWQAVARACKAGTLVVVHTFPGGPPRITLPLAGAVKRIYARAGIVAEATGEALTIHGLMPLDGVAIWLEA